MSTVGFRGAQARAIPVIVADGVSIPFVSPTALALLKLTAWSERGGSTNRKDARDLALLLTTYLRAGNEQRLYSEHAALLEEADFDLETVGARILGRDIAMMIDDEVLTRVAAVLNQGMDKTRGEPLLRALPLSSEHGKTLLSALRKGLREGA